jgi:hypothetical protein
LAEAKSQNASAHLGGINIQAEPPAGVNRRASIPQQQHQLRCINATTFALHAGVHLRQKRSRRAAVRESRTARDQADFLSLASGWL